MGQAACKRRCMGSWTSWTSRGSMSVSVVVARFAVAVSSVPGSSSRPGPVADISSSVGMGTEMCPCTVSKHGVLAALDQRIAISYQMPTMTKEETVSYIKHHLTIAGRSDPLFSDDAVDLIHLTSRGLPRLVNNIALQSLIAAFADEKSIVDESSTRRAITETHATE